MTTSMGIAWINAGSIQPSTAHDPLACQRAFSACTLGAATEDTTTSSSPSVIPRHGAHPQGRRSRLRVIGQDRLRAYQAFQVRVSTSALPTLCPRSSLAVCNLPETKGSACLLVH